MRSTVKWRRRYETTLIALLIIIVTGLWNFGKSFDGYTETIRNESQQIVGNERLPLPTSYLTVNNDYHAKLLVEPTSSPTTANRTPFPLYQRANNLTKHATVIVQLSGELANNLHHISHGIGLQELARSFGVSTNLVIHRGTNKKWKLSRQDIANCFPILRNWTWASGTTKEFETINRLQIEQWLGKERYDYMTGLLNAGNVTELERGMKYVVQVILNDSERPYVDPSSTIQLPFLLSTTLDVFPMVDRYVDKIREVFQFDNAACCARIPQSHERTVFHYRNYLTELRDAYSMGFSELSVNKTIHELFRHKNWKGRFSSTTFQEDHGISNNNNNTEKNRETVLVTTRFPNKYARAFVEAFQEEFHVQAELISNQSGVQDFCLLKETTDTLVGNARSTFVFWAAVLGKAQTVRLYHVDNFGLRNRHANFWERFTYNWTNSDLMKRIHFELYQAEEIDLRSVKG